jgi:hypothetical protein
MMPTMVMVLAITASVGLRAVLGRQHPLALLPLVLACAVWFESTRGTGWQPAFLVLGLVLAGLAVKRTIESTSTSTQGPSDAAE